MYSFALIHEGSSDVCVGLMKETQRENALQSRETKSSLQTIFILIKMKQGCRGKAQDELLPVCLQLGEAEAGRPSRWVLILFP